MRHRVLLLLALALATQRLGAQPSHPAELEFPPSRWRPPGAAESRLELAGGAVAYLVPDTTLPLVDLVVVARAGAYRDPEDARGLAELTAAMLRRGGTLDLDPNRFDERADELGAVLSSQSTMLWGVAALRCTRETLAESVALWLEMIERPAFDPGRLDVIRRSMVEGMARRNLDPLRLLRREWEWLTYGADHFSTRPLRPGDLAALDSRRLHDFHRRHWRPANFLVAAAGAITAAELRDLLNPRFAAWPAAGDPAGPAPWPPAGPAAGSPPGLYHAHADIPQAKVMLGHRSSTALPTVEERVQLEVVAELLAGQGAISRLNGRLRSAEGLVYRVSAQLDPGDLWPADHSIFFDTLETNVPRAVAAALEEIDRLRSTPPAPTELAVVQRELLARRRLEFDTAEEAAGYLVQDALVDRDPQYRARYVELVESVTAAQVMETARRHLDPAALRVLVVGRWPAIAGVADSSRWTELERTLRHRVRHLPPRDPLTLAPLETP